MTREQIKEKLLNMIGSKVTMFVDRPIHSTHPKTYFLWTKHFKYCITQHFKIALYFIVL